MASVENTLRVQRVRGVGRPLYLAIVALPFGMFLSLPVLRTLDKTVPLTLSEITLAVLIATYLRRRVSDGIPITRRVRGAAPIFLFLGWATVSLLLGAWRFDLSAWQTAISGLYLLRWAAYGFFYFAVFEAAVDRRTAAQMVKWVLVGTLVFALFGLVQSAIFPGDFALWLHPGARPYVDYDPQGHRLVSSFLDPNIAAGFILISALLALSFYAHGFKRWLWPLIILVVALVATLSRGGAFGFVVGVLFLFKSAHSRRSWLLKAGLVIVAASLALYPLLAAGIERTARFDLHTGDSIALRVMWWQNDLELIANNPVTGIGFNTLGYVSGRYMGELGAGAGGASAFGISGDLLMITMLTGGVGLFIYLLMLKEMLLPLLRLGDGGASVWERAFGRGAWAASVGAVASSCFATIIVYPQIMAALWVLWAVGRRFYGDSVMRNRALARRGLPAAVNLEPNSEGVA